MGARGSGVEWGSSLNDLFMNECDERIDLESKDQKQDNDDLA